MVAFCGSTSRAALSIKIRARKSASRAALPAMNCPPITAEPSMAVTSGEPNCQRDESMESGIEVQSYTPVREPSLLDFPEPG